jgi:hypothetical protein
VAVADRPERSVGAPIGKASCHGCGGRTAGIARRDLIIPWAFCSVLRLNQRIGILLSVEPLPGIISNSRNRAPIRFFFDCAAKAGLRLGHCIKPHIYSVRLTMFFEVVAAFLGVLRHRPTHTDRKASRFFVFSPTLTSRFSVSTTRSAP